MPKFGHNAEWWNNTNTKSVSTHDHNILDMDSIEYCGGARAWQCPWGCTEERQPGSLDSDCRPVMPQD